MVGRLGEMAEPDGECVGGQAGCQIRLARPMSWHRSFNFACRGETRVAGYHANLIYNAGGGTAAGLRALIGELQARVRERFGLDAATPV